MIFNPEYECMPRGEMENLQSERLRDAVKRAYEHVAFYRGKMDQIKLKPKDIRGLEDLPKLPFTTKDDMRENYPFGLFAVPLDQVVRVHSSSGTTGKPTLVGYTRKDIDIWATTMARTICLGGGTPEDVLQVAYGYGLFTGGLGLHYGGEKLGCMVVPMSGGNTKRQVMLMQDLGTTILGCTPSYSLFIAEEAEAMGFDIKQLPLRTALLGAEPWTDNMRKEIEKRLGVKALDIFGLSEIMGPGVAAECLVQKGLHVSEDHYLPEVIDPDTLEVVPPGTRGELVYTCLTKEATPMIRYRTRDISRISYAPCECGRTQVKMERVTGRTDDMLIIRGVNVFPSQIESVLVGVEGTLPHYLIVVDKRGTLDELEIQVEVDEKIFSDEVRQLEELRNKIARELESVLSVSAVVKLVEPQTIERSMGKAKRVIDKRIL